VKTPSSDDTAIHAIFRPDVWPAGHRSALVVMVDLDPNPLTRSRFSPLNDAAGAERVLTMLADLDIAPTLVIEPEPPYAVPVLPEVAGDWAVWLRGQHLDLKAVSKALDQRGGGELRGLVLADAAIPQSLDRATLWVMDGSASPFPQRTRNGGVIIPYTAWWHDATWFDPARPAPPSAMLEAWSLGLSSVRTRGELMVVMLSSEVAGLPGAIETVQRFLDDAVGAGDVWITNATAVANHVRSTQRDLQE
jgi:hypothetical protein